MNIVIFTDCYYPIVKSGAIIVGDLAAELTQQGYGVTVVTFVDELSDTYQTTIDLVFSFTNKFASSDHWV